MSQTIDNRVVELDFDNQQFEKGVSQSLNTLDKLKSALKMDDAAKNLQSLSNASKNFDMSGMVTALDRVSDRFSTFRLLGIHALGNIVDAAMGAGKKIFQALNAPITQAATGGWARAANLENARFKLDGVLQSAGKVEEAMKNVDESVQGTAYSLDEAAVLASQFAASGVKVGDELTNALKSVVGVAAQTGSSFIEIGDIFNNVNSRGKLTANELNRLAVRGVNAVSVLAKHYGVSEAELRQMVTKGKVQFKEFSDAMYEAFGENAYKANNTFDGALANMKSALNRIGAEFATPLRKNAIPVFNELRLMFNEIKRNMSGVFEIAQKVMNFLGQLAVSRISKITSFLKNDFRGLDNINRGLKNILDAIVRVLAVFKSALNAVFPRTKSFANTINSLAEGFEKFTQKLIMSTETMNRVRSVLIVLLSIVKVVLSVVKVAFKLIFNIGHILATIVAGIVNFIQYLGNLVVGLFNVNSEMTTTTKLSDRFKNIIDRLSTFFKSFKDELNDTSTILGKFVAGLKTAVTTIISIIGGTLYLAFNKLKNIFKSLSKIRTFDDLKAKISNFLIKVKEMISYIETIPVVGKVVSALEIAFLAVVGSIQKAVEWFKELFDTIKNGEFTIESFKDKLLEIPQSISDKFKSLMDSKGLSKVLDTLKDKFIIVKKYVVDFFNSFKSETGKIDTSRVLLYAYSVVLMIIALNANKAIKAVTGLLNAVSAGINKIAEFFNPNKLSLFQKFVIVIAELAGTIIILTKCIKELSSIPTDTLNEVVKNVVILVSLVGGIGLLASLLDAIASKLGAKGISSFSLNMITLSGGIAALVGSLWLLDKVDMTNIEQKVILLGSIMVGLVSVSVLMSWAAPQLSKGSVFLLAFSGSMLLLVEALRNLSRIDFTSISENWKAITAVLLSFGAIAALSSTLSFGSIIGFLGFILALRVLGKNMEALKAAGIPDLIISFIEELKIAFDTFVDRLKEIINRVVNGLTYVWDSTKELSDNIGGLLSHIVNLVGYISIAAVAIGSALGTLYIIGTGAKGFKAFSKMLISLAITLGAIVGLSYIVAKASETMPEIFHAIRYMGYIIAALAGLAISASFISENGMKSLKAIRGSIIGLALIMAAMAGFLLVVDNLKDPEKAMYALYNVIVLLGIIGAVITTLSRLGEGTHANFGHFAGMLLMFGGIIGSLVLLMNAFKDIKDFKDGANKILPALLVIGAVVGGMSLLMRQLSKIRVGTGWKTIMALFGGLTLIMGAVAGLSILLKKENVSPASVIALGATATGILSVIVLLASQMQRLAKSTKYSITETSAKSLESMLKTIGMLCVAALALAGSIALMGTHGWKQNLANALILAGLMVGLFGAMQGIVKAAKKVKLKDVKDILLIMTAIEGLLGGLVLIFAGINKMKLSDDILDKLTIIGLAFGSIIILAETLKKANENFNWNQILGFIGEGIMLALFEGLVLIFQQIENLNIDGLAEKVKLIGFTLAQLAVLAEGMQLLGSSLDWKSLLGVLGTGGMLGLFWGLSEIFKAIDTLNPKGLLGKAESMILVLFELEVLLVAAGAIGYVMVDTYGLGALAVGLGLAAVEGMILIFEQLTKVFSIIDGMKTEGILKKSETIILILFELEVLSAASIFAIPALIGVWPLRFMVQTFEMLAQVFLVIDGMKLEGILRKAEVLVLVLLELELLGSVSILATPAFIGAPALASMVEVLNQLALVFAILDGLQLEGMQEKVDVLIGVITSLTLVGAFAGGFAGGGLTMLAVGIMALGSSLYFAVGAFDLASDSITRLSTSLMMLSTSIAMMGSSIATSILSISNSVVLAITTLVNTIITTLQTLLTQAVPLIYLCAFGIGNGIIEGFRDGVGWHSPPSFVGEFLDDTVLAFQDGVNRIISKIAEFGKKIAESFENGFRDSIGWHSPPEFIEKFFPDLVTAFDIGTSGSESGIKGAGELIGKYFIDGALNGLMSGEGDIIAEVNKIMAMMSGALSTMSAYEAQMKRGYSTTLSNYDYQLTTEIAMAKKELSDLKSMSADVDTEYRHRAKSSKELTTQIEEQEKKIKDLEDAHDGLSGAMNKAEDQANEFGDALNNLGGSAGKAKNELEEFRDSLKSTLQSQMDMFSKFEEKQAMSKEDMLNNMRSQIKGVTAWAADINKLSERGIDQGLLQKLTELGPEGRDKVAAFVSMTSEELAEANQLWVDSLAIQDFLPDYLMNSMQQAGMNVGLGLTEGMALNSGTAIEAMGQLGFDMNAKFCEQMGIASPSQVMMDNAMWLMFGMRDGITTWAPVTVYPALEAFALTCIYKVCNAFLMASYQSRSEVFYQIGAFIVQGLADGIRDNIDLAVAAAQEMAEAVAGAFEGASPAGLGGESMVGSPSPVFRRFGKWLDEGLALGIKDGTGMVVNSVEDLATESLSAMKSTIAMISSMVTDEFEDPVITPILDLSNVQAGARKLNSVLTQNAAYAASGSMNGLQNEQPNAKFGNTFIQNNYSPKALSRIDIYRDTKNLFSRAKVGMI